MFFFTSSDSSTSALVYISYIFLVISFQRDTISLFWLLNFSVVKAQIMKLTWKI